MLKKQIVPIMALITTVAVSQSQFRINEKETFNAGVISSFDAVGVEIEYSGTIYARPFVTNKSFVGAIGVNFTSGLWEKFRYYSGIRLHKKIYIAVPIAGLETGINYQLTDGIFIGLRGVCDLKVEQSKTSTTPDAFIKLGFNF